MRKLLLILIAACSITACKKSNVTPGLFGRWELRSTSGGFRDSTYAAGNGNLIQFYSDSTYKKYAATKLTAQGTFRIVGNFGPSANSVVIIYFDQSTSGEPFQLNGTTLSIGSSAADGPESDYQKISD